MNITAYLRELVLSSSFSFSLIDALIDSSSYLDWGLQLQKYRLRNKDLSGLGAKMADLGLEQLDLLSGTTAPHLQQSINDRIQIDLVLVRHRVCVCVGWLPVQGREKKK